MSKLVFDPDPFEPRPEISPPEGGWQTPDCTFESHSWMLEIDNGRASIMCTDPCNPDLFDPEGRTPTCQCDWQPEDYSTPDPIPVTLTYVDDSTPSGPWGPSEYGYYIEVRAKASPEAGSDA